MDLMIPRQLPVSDLSVSIHGCKAHAVETPLLDFRSLLDVQFFLYIIFFITLFRLRTFLKGIEMQLVKHCNLLISHSGSRLRAKGIKRLVCFFFVRFIYFFSFNGGRVGSRVTLARLR